MLNIAAEWEGADDAARHVDWARRFWEDMRSLGAGGTYGNFLNTDADEDRLRQAYRDNYDRLARLKARYDREHVFRINLNVRPASREA